MRKCKNWLAAFMDWTVPRSEAKESYVFWTGLYTLACVLRRHVKIPKKYLGSWEVYPYLYLMFVGPAGNRKTTTANYNIELLDEVPGLVAAPDSVTVPKLASMLAEANECSMYINAGEFSEFIVKSGLDMFGFLTKAFDGQKKLSQGTHMRDIELAEKPCINFLGATTPEWIADNIPQSILDGGFGSRTLFIYEEEVRERRLIYKDWVNVKDLYDKYYDNLVNDLRYIANNIYGDFQLTDDGAEFIDKWYREGAGYDKRKIKMKGYYERKPAHVMKVAMLLKIAEGSVLGEEQLILTKEDFENSIKVVESVEENMYKVFGGIGKNMYKADLKNMLEYIRDNGPISKANILEHFQASAEPRKLEELINGLNSAGLIEFQPQGMDIFVKVKERKNV